MRRWGRPDAVGDVTETVDGDGRPSYSYYDLDGEVTETVDAAGHVTQSYCDGDGRVTESVDADGRPSFSYYDGDGNLTEQIDARGVRTYSYFDAGGRVTEAVDVAVAVGGFGDLVGTVIGAEGCYVAILDRSHIAAHLFGRYNGGIRSSIS